MFNSSSLNVYFICGTQDVPEGKDIREILKQALEAGITLFNSVKRANIIRWCWERTFSNWFIKTMSWLSSTIYCKWRRWFSWENKCRRYSCRARWWKCEVFSNASKIKSLGLALEMRKNIIIRIWNMLIILELDLCLQQSLKMMLTHQ